MSNQCSESDLLRGPVALVLWYIPGALVLIGVFWREGRAWLWTPALAVAGTACLVNASRCGRLHCYFTGPLWLLGAMATLLRAFSIVRVPWNWILYAVLGGGLLAFAPEWFRGRYVTCPSPDDLRRSSK